MVRTMQIGQNHPTHSAAKLSGSQSPPKKQGALIIIDSFHSSTEHGKMVEQTALDMGPTGKVYRYNHMREVDGKPTAPVQDATNVLVASMTSSFLPPEEASAHLDKFINNSVTSLLDWTSSLLGEVTQDGFKDSVANLSQGMSAIEYFGSAKQPLMGNYLNDQQKQYYINNLISAVNPDPSQTPDGSQFDKMLLNRIKTTLRESPRIQESKKRWKNQVKAFEADSNSIVVAAGNSGEFMSKLMAGDFDADGSEDENILATADTTMVAATATTEDGSIFLASPSSFGPEVDFIASGFHGDHFGSSFAAPKVSTAMLALHVSNPGSDSEAVEESTSEVLGQKVNIRGHNVTILNEPLTSRALQQIVDDKVSG